MQIICKADQERSLREVDHKIRDNLQRIRESIAHSLNLGVAGSNVVLNSLVGKSAFIGGVKNVIPGVQGQNRAVNLDVDFSAKIGQLPPHKALPVAILAQVAISVSKAPSSRALSRERD